jgi:ABC-2 type transport system ATP-binding protein
MMSSDGRGLADESDGGVPGAQLSAHAVIQVQNLHKSFGDVQALRGVSFEIPSGAVVGFLGPNGAGKTTAIKILTGYLAADQGTARICGHDVESEPLAAKALVGYLPENNPLYTDMRVEQYLSFAWKAQMGKGVAGESKGEAIDRVVQATSLQMVFRRNIGDCSKGYRQRVGLAQALLHDPPLLVLDEPTNGLDPLQVVEIRDLIRNLGQSKTVILTTHVLPEVEALADRVVLIHQGKKVADDSLQQLAQSGDGARARVVVEGSKDQLERSVEEAGCEVRQWLTAPFGDRDHCGAIVRLSGSGGADALRALSQAVTAHGLTLLEMNAETGTLESLFRDLQAGAVGA